MSSLASEIQQPTFSNYKAFEKNFEYKGDRLYSMIFERNKDKIKISKEKFAIRNLEKIFNATFKMSPKIGFQAMSLRDLSAETGLSMGGLYSSISSKESIAVMVKDVVALTCEEIVEVSRAQKDSQLALEIMVRGFVYASTLMQSWFNFLYFETKSLPQNHQEESKNLEIEQVKVLTDILIRLKPDNNNQQAQFVATMTLSLIQERYLKPWKYSQATTTVDEYADDCLALIYNCIDYQAA